MASFDELSQCTSPSQDGGDLDALSPCITPGQEAPRTPDPMTMPPCTPDIGGMAPRTPEANADVWAMAPRTPDAGSIRRRISGKSKPPAAYFEPAPTELVQSSIGDDALAQEAMVEVTALGPDAQRQHVHYTHVRTFNEEDRQPESFSRQEFWEHMAAFCLLSVRPSVPVEIGKRWSRSDFSNAEGFKTKWTSPCGESVRRSLS